MMASLNMSERLLDRSISKTTVSVTTLRILRRKKKVLKSCEPGKDKIQTFAIFDGSPLGSARLSIHFQNIQLPKHFPKHVTSSGGFALKHQKYSKRVLSHIFFEEIILGGNKCLIWKGKKQSHTHLQIRHVRIFDRNRLPAEYLALSVPHFFASN